jgi:Tol biopolymer transport system component
MSLAAGTRLGVYEVLELIGAGGMGEVYRARDAKLGRDVALKILPELVAVDPDRLARFKREAQVLASLNHANIAAIYGFEDSVGVHALVLEMVEGPTLADRISRGPIPIDEAMPIARQIADAFEVAHALGIVHRDLKPANIKVRADGTVKVLDFGLAKALAGDGAAKESSQFVTITSPAATQFGVILGTAAYMSPEQARGRTVDKRSDIWAFGAVLYEMLSGARAFDGDDVSYTLANILKTDPDWSRLPAETPSSIQRVLRRCLEKDSKRRYHDIADARLDLEELPAPAPPAHPIASARRSWLERAAWLLVVAVLGAGLAYRVSKPLPRPQVVRFSVDPPEGTAFGTVGGISGIAAATSGTISPDGSRLLFVATDKKTGASAIWLRPLDSGRARPLPGTEGGFQPFWHPSGGSLAFFTAGKLKKLDLSGGLPRTVCDVTGVSRGGTWASGVIVYAAGNPGSIYRVSDEGGAPTPFLGGASGSVGMFAWPQFLPDGRRFLYWGATPQGRGVYVGSIDSGFVPKRLMESDAAAGYAAPGYLLYTRDDTLMRRAFDPDRLELSGEAIPLVEQILNTEEFGVAAFSPSANGSLTFRSGTALSHQFAWFDRAGRLLETVGPPGNYRMPALSPDESTLAYVDANQRDIWLLDLVRKIPSRFTSEPGSEACPVWFPDGTKLAFRRLGNGEGVYEQDLNGDGKARQIADFRINGPSQVLADGKSLLYFFVGAGGAHPNGIFVLPLTGDRKPKLVVPANVVEPMLSRDNKWIAYAASATGTNEIYVQPYPPTGESKRVSIDGGRQPFWSHDGKELYFVNEARKFYALDVDASSGQFKFGEARYLFDLRSHVFNTRNSYVPSRDGKRFLVNMLLESGDAPISVITNWTAGLKN